MDIDEITGTVIGAAMRIHTALGPGLLESVYERILARDLRRRGLVVDRQQSIDFHFDGMLFEDAFRPDLIIEGAVIVEVKSVESIAPVHARQLLTYLRLLDCRVGLLINFNVPHLKTGLRRVINSERSPTRHVP